jgi:hypothetical protein
MEDKIWKLLKFDKGDIMFYLIFGVILIYIWQRSNISINYYLPFIILCIVIYLRQDYLHIIDLKVDHKLSDFKNTILKDKKYNAIENNSEILYWLNDIKKYRTYNNKNFILLLDLLNKFYLNNDIYYLHLCLNNYDNFIYSLPLELVEDHYLNKIKLSKILYKNLKNPKYKMVEMQSYIPSNFDDNYINHYL